jgi:hypothetical protein
MAMSILNSIRQRALPTIIIVIGYINLLSFIHHTASLPARAKDPIVIQEERYRTIRELLVEVGYSGPIDFITNRDLKSEPQSDQDGVEWAQSQYVMVPWILLRNGRPPSGPPFMEESRYVIGDFWDNEPSEIPAHLIQFHNTGRGLILYRRKQP